MEIAVSRYQLQQVDGACRHGALIRVTAADGSRGYADCHPWHENGDLPLEEQLKRLASGKTTNLIERSLAAAALDAEGRRLKKHLMAELPLISSHYFMGVLGMGDQDLKKYTRKGTNLVKIKVGVDPQAELTVIKRWKTLLQESGLKLRLDFNCRLDHDSFEKYLKALGDLREHIDFYEDPYAYDPVKWKQLQDKYGIVLACDLESLRALEDPESCGVLVVKPAIQELVPFLTKKRSHRRLVITSYLDHPIGQLYAAYVAACAEKESPGTIDVCGLMTHVAYVTTPFSSALSDENGCLVSSLEGYGWGYNQLLEGLSWQKL